MNGRLDTIIQRNPLRGAYDVYFLLTTWLEGKASRAVATKIDFTTINDEEGAHRERLEPAFFLRTEELQILMDEIWRVGIRPTEGTGSAGSLAATQAHLKDMQQIAMRSVEVHLSTASKEMSQQQLEQITNIIKARLNEWATEQTRMGGHLHKP